MTSLSQPYIDLFHAFYSPQTSLQSGFRFFQFPLPPLPSHFFSTILCILCHHQRSSSLILSSYPLQNFLRSMFYHLTLKLRIPTLDHLYNFPYTDYHSNTFTTHTHFSYHFPTSHHSTLNYNAGTFPSHQIYFIQITQCIYHHQTDKICLIHPFYCRTIVLHRLNLLSISLSRNHVSYHSQFIHSIFNLVQVLPFLIVKAFILSGTKLN